MPPIESPPRPPSWPALPSPAALRPDAAELRAAEARAAERQRRADGAGTTAYRRTHEEADRPAGSAGPAGSGSSGSGGGEGSAVRLPGSSWEVLSGFLGTPGLTIEHHHAAARAYRAAEDTGRVPRSGRLTDLSV
ncbi:MAG: hypothetical protein KDA49_10785 [Rhodospirillaceae bacterium]|nr:hypothetical protein [Rhodospirillaceae bacterium]